MSHRTLGVNTLVRAPLFSLPTYNMRTSGGFAASKEIPTTVALRVLHVYLCARLRN